METTTNSEMFERVARRELSPQDAARLLMKRDEESRKRQVSAARPGWMPRWAWAVATVLIVAAIDTLQRRT